MPNDLHTPLRGRPSPRRRPDFLKAGRLLACLCLVSVGAFSIYTTTRDNGLSNVPGVVTGMPKAPEKAAVPDSADTQPADAAQIARADRASGANVTTTVNGDGSVVTMYRPRTRDDNGPVLIDAMQIGQDPQVAAIPNETLLEDTPAGRLPVVGPDGRRSMDQYARPPSDNGGTRIAIVVSGLGLSQTGTQRAIKLLPEEVTLAFAASGNSLQRWMQQARQSGHEILLQVPLEPFDYPANDPGPGTLLTKKPTSANLEALHRAMGAITNYTGIMNYQGGRFLSMPDVMAPVMNDIAKRGLLFLDDGSSASSKTADVAKATSLPYAFGDVQLDTKLDAGAITAKLDELERVARAKGTAIGVASAFDESVDAIASWCEAASLRGIEIVGVAALAKDPAKP
ncbi:divergent polysaccharide deacetylase family protein [Oryzifoliimicrobium ureilyticus]|uniref:divergent polysaccharide deacetylase family protein n=1 Tax=Oryzifoliimicrobium ureilyticus TaxID=3113724 RepID=UPI00307667A2